MKNQFLFSVIIPVYNVENYLSETIESVIAQDIGFEEHIQMILVNDGSPDNSEAICLRYRDAYPDNIIYIKQENTGVSAARNAGIPYIQGKYVNFLDGDDKWAPDAFRQVAAFYAKNKDSVDVVVCRMQFFEARSDYHPLDYKFQKNRPERMIDITCTYNDLHVHVTSSFLLTESLGDTRFDTRLKFGEDTLFLTQMILKKQKYGALYNGNYYYRKRSAASSAVQTQSKHSAWLHDSPKYYLEALAQHSLSTYGTLFPYVQSVLFYDLGYRLTLPTYEQFPAEDYNAYVQFLGDLLRNYVSDLVILTQKRYDRAVQLTALKLKYGDALREQVTVADSTVYFNCFLLVKLRKNKTLLRIHSMKLQKGKLYLEGAVCQWFKDLFGDGFRLYFHIPGHHSYDPEWLPESRYTPSSWRNTVLGKEPQWAPFQVAIPLNRGAATTIIAKFQLNDYYYSRVPLSFGKFAPLNHKLKHTYCFLNRHLLQLTAPHQLQVSKPKYKLKALIAQEWALEQELRALGKGSLNRLRRKAIWLSRRSKKKIWLISDRPDVAGDNGEAFFKYLVQACPPDVDPYFVIKKDSPDFQRMRQYGKVLSAGSEQHLIYTLAADCYIDSSGLERIVPPYRQNA